MKNRLPLLLAFATIAVPFSAHAAEYTVNTLTDDTVAVIANTDTGGTLRQVITNANATPGDDTIIFSVNGTITLTSAIGAVGSSTNGALTITGPAAGIAISGNNTSRVFQITGGNATVTLNNLTIRDARISAGNGAGIANNGGNLTVNNCTLINNVNAGTGFGGAISVGTTTANAGSLTITNSTLANNSATTRGGGIGVARSTTTIQSCTITNNTAPAGAGGGISASNTGTVVNVGNSIIAGNNGTDADNVTANVTSFTSQGNNAIGNGSATTGTTPNFVNATNNDKVGVTAAQIKLDALADNGGPTQTIALVAGSVAIDAGVTALAVDQRGVARPQGAAKDIGAYEGSIANRAPRLNNATYTGSVSSAFSQQLAGTDPDSDTLTYALATGSALPAGLTLDSATGIISGTPTTAGRTDFSVTVTDGVTPAITSKFIIIISAAGADGVGPVLTRTALNPSYTRAQLASLLYTGTVRDVAQTATPVVDPVGVKQVLFQLRQGATAYSGNETTGFTADLNRGYFPAFLGAPTGGTPPTAGTSTFRRNFASFIPSNLAVGSYSLVILGQDNLNNFSVEVVPVTITAPAAGAAKSSFGVSGSANGS